MYPYNSSVPYTPYYYQEQYEGQPQYQPYIEQAEQMNPYDPNRQFQMPISFPGASGRQLERRVNELEQRVNQLNRQVQQLQQTAERHTRRLNRLNQRLRTVENRLNIPFSALEDGF
ncbi:hypothetical protein [Bacillus sp. C1]